MVGRLIVASVLAVVGAGASVASSASAAPSATGVAHSHRRVCALPAAGHAACDSHVVTDAGTGRPLATTTFSSGYTPQQLRTAYGVPSTTTTTTVAVVDAYANPNAASDLAAYRSHFGLGTANLTQVNQTGGSVSTVAGDTGWGQEEMLDLEMVSAMCPTCSILYVGASSASFGDLSTAVDTARARGAAVISNSYGGSEFSGEVSSSSHYNIPGVAVTVSSGDSGYGTQFPASAQDVVAVGGTSLKLDSTGHRVSETVWSGAGSGCSAYVGKPSWQRDTGCSRRTVADVAAVADPNTGVAVYDSYGSTGGANWYVFGGTSVAAPLVGGVYAVYGIPSSGSGYPVQASYTSPVGSLFDVTSGSNGRCTTRRSTANAYLCTGVVGYDGPTGNGTPNSSANPF